MSLTVTFTKRKNVLVASLHGIFDAKSDEAADRQVAEACNVEGYTAVLMDFRAVEVAPLAYESYHSGVSLGDRGFNQTTRIAILDRSEFKQANDLYGLVARNRGYLLQHFYSEKEAMAWLQGDARSSTG